MSYLVRKYNFFMADILIFNAAKALIELISWLNYINVPIQNVCHKKGLLSLIANDRQTWIV